MSLTELSLTNVRCLEQACLQLGRGLTLIWGANGSGKTSLLEAIFLLGRGRSFRSRNTERLIRYEQAHMRVSGQVTRATGTTERLVFDATREGSSARIGTRPAESFAQLSREFPVQVIEPGIHRLVEEGGYRRRRWLDWAVFHVEPTFVETWIRYNRALRQRNAALKLPGGDAATWEPELARLGESIAVSRGRFVDQLQPYWHDTVAALSGLPVELHYHRGWSQEHTLREALSASLARDSLRQATHVGPHRADVVVRLHGRPAREVLSRGQQKLVATAMTVAQLRLLQALVEITPTLLLDDPAAELDGERLERFIGVVAALRSQLVVTSLHAESRLFGAPERTFHVEHGRVQPV
jgi:DNA replication and repair protein RecF